MITAALVKFAGWKVGSTSPGLQRDRVLVVAEELAADDVTTAAQFAMPVGDQRSADPADGVLEPCADQAHQVCEDAGG